MTGIINKQCHYFCIVYLKQNASASPSSISSDSSTRCDEMCTAGCVTDYEAQLGGIFQFGSLTLITGKGLDVRDTIMIL
jgi:hypothetical protein